MEDCAICIKTDVGIQRVTWFPIYLQKMVFIKTSTDNFQFLALQYSLEQCKIFSDFV